MTEEEKQRLLAQMIREQEYGASQPTESGVQRQQSGGGGISPGMAMQFMPEGAEGASGGEGAMSYAVPAAVFAGFVQQAHKQGLIDKNNEVMEDTGRKVKDGVKKLSRKLKPWEWW